MNQPATDTIITSHGILMPFSNGDLARVSLSVYKAPKGQSRPIDAYVVTECDGDFTGAARRAAEAVYNLAQKHLAHTEQMVVGLDIQGLSPGSAPVTGESGGLSFAIARKKQISLHPVSTIAEAIYAAYKINIVDEKSKRTLHYTSKSFIVIILVIIVALFLINANQADKLMDSGKSTGQPVHKETQVNNKSETPPTQPSTKSYPDSGFD